MLKQQNIDHSQSTANVQSELISICFILEGRHVEHAVINRDKVFIVIWDLVCTDFQLFFLDILYYSRDC